MVVFTVLDIDAIALKQTRSLHLPFLPRLLFDNELFHTETAPERKLNLPVKAAKRVPRRIDITIFSINTISCLNKPRLSRLGAKILCGPSFATNKDPPTLESHGTHAIHVYNTFSPTKLHTIFY